MKITTVILSETKNLWTCSRNTRIRERSFTAFGMTIVFFAFLFLFLPMVHAQTTPDTNTSEEQAVYNLNTQLPPGVIPSEPKATDNNPLFNLINSIKNWAGNLLFFNQPFHPVKVFQQSGSIHQAELPDELKPNPSSNPTDQLKESLSSQSGVYGVTLPDLGQKGIGQSEKNYEQANFPSGVNPITGQ
jgi:hypothetical protein